MKGLLIKDFRLMKNQKMFFMVVAVVWFFLALTYDNPVFCIAYVSMMFSFFTLSTFSYDLYENGITYLLTLPVTRKAYVREKYLFGLLVSVVPWCFCNIAQCAVMAVKGSETELMEYLAGAIAGLALVFLMMALEIPIQLRFGPEKSRMITLMWIGIMGAIIWLVNRLTDIGALLSAADEIFTFGTGVTVALLTVLLVLLIGVSYRLSVGIMEKKEF